ncbi:MAG: DUF488 domain-containing protein [Thermoplasmata archaeon]
MAGRRTNEGLLGPVTADEAHWRSGDFHPSPPIFTIGHSTRSIQELVDALTGFSVTRVLDVRTVRKSRHNPQFNEADLPGSLKPSGIDYAIAPALGGLRKPRKDSKNMGWRNSSFRGYADHMESVEFDRALTELIMRSRIVFTALMCAEAVPWRCHRSLIADALVLRGIEVRHILSAGSSTPHRLTSFLVEREGRPTYPADSKTSTLDQFG